MMAKHPLDLPVGRKLSKEEVVDALRLSIIAELDAISLYLQIARSVDDERVRKVFEDIAREEKTHVGEFLALLKRFDAEQVVELQKGEEEVVELTGIPRPSGSSSENPLRGNPEEDFNSLLAKKFREALDSSRVLLGKLPRLTVGRGVESVPYPSAEGGERGLAALKEVSLRFKVPQKAVDYHARYGIFEVPEVGFSARQLAVAEEKFVAEALLGCERAKRAKMGAWEAPGQSVTDIAAALAELYKSGVRKPILLVLPSARYVKLMNVSERTGVTDLERVKALVDEIVVSDLLPEDTVVLLAATADVVDVVLGGDGEIDYIGPEDGYHAYRAWSSVAVRVKDPGGLVILKEEKR